MPKMTTTMMTIRQLLLHKSCISEQLVNGRMDKDHYKERTIEDEQNNFLLVITSFTESNNDEHRFLLEEEVIL